MLVIKDEQYKIKVGAEVFSVEYPSFEEAQAIAEEFDGLSGKEATDKMKAWLKNLGLSDEFFTLKAIKAKHIVAIWLEINSVKK